MAELLTSQQMRALERRAMESGAVSGARLMERAGRAVVAAIADRWPDLAAGHAVILCGPGNNGGDGYVIARLLAGRGWRVEVFALGDPAQLKGDAATMRDLWSETAGIRPLDEAGEGQRPDLVVDALFGTGLSRPIPEPAAAAVAAVRARPEGAAQCHLVAVDCPSGLDCDTGQTLGGPAAGHREAAAGRAFAADLTVTFHAAKRGHVLGDGPARSGHLVIADIGLAPWDDPPSPRDALPAPGRLRRIERCTNGAWPVHVLCSADPGRHKYDRGHALVLAGGVGKGGAGRLAARAALRVGAGLATLACPPAALIENAARLDAVMLRPLADAAALEEMLADRRLSALCLGPGLGVGQRTRDTVSVALAAGRRTVLDADALTSFADDPRALFAQLHEGCVLTPHEGEFSRLFRGLSSLDRVVSGQSKVDAACAAADRAGCTILLKGVDTVIASPGGHASVHAAIGARAAPWLGTAGAGDVLAGLIAGLAAADDGIHVHLKAEAAAWFHVEAARCFGPGLIAEDLPEQLPGVFRDLGA